MNCDRTTVIDGRYTSNVSHDGRLSMEPTEVKVRASGPSIGVIRFSHTYTPRGNLKDATRVGS